MPFFAIALVPGGNILRTIGDIKTLNFRRGGSGYARGLPEAIYLGFYSGSVGGKSVARRFHRQGNDILASLPEKLICKEAATREGYSYIASALPLDATRTLCDKTAASLGFLPAEDPPFCPGLGFFIGKDVTLPAFEAFSFRHLDLVCMKIDRGDEEWLSLAWTVIAVSPRRIGLRNTPRGLEE